MSFVSGLSESVVNTNALLGYIDVQIDEDNVPYPTDSIIGSQPIPLHEQSPIPGKYVHCGNCDRLMRLLLQCNANLEDTWYERCIYVFACIEPRCRRTKGAIRCVRGVKKDPVLMKKKESEEKARVEAEKKKKEEAERKVKEQKEKMLDLFGSKANTGNPFAGGTTNPFGSSSTLSNPFAMNKIEKVMKNDIEKSEGESSKKPTKPTFADVAQEKSTIKEAAADIEHIRLPEFPGSILYFESECLDPKNQYLPPLPDNLKIQEDGSVIDDNASVKSGNLPKINPEKSKENEEIAKMVEDQTFQNFSNVVSFNTGQVVRYELNGQPLLYSSKDDVSHIFYDSNGKLKPSSEWNIPSPSYNPSGARRFELQLMPKMIIDLEKDAVIDILRDGMEWGTIIVATDCDDTVPLNMIDKYGVSYIEEWCGVQWEEEVNKH